MERGPSVQPGPFTGQELLLRLADGGDEHGRSPEHHKVQQGAVSTAAHDGVGRQDGLAEPGVVRIVDGEDIAGPVFPATGPAREDQGGSSASLEAGREGLLHRGPLGLGATHQPEKDRSVVQRLQGGFILHLEPAQGADVAGGGADGVRQSTGEDAVFGVGDPHFVKGFRIPANDRRGPPPDRRRDRRVQLV